MTVEAPQNGNARPVFDGDSDMGAMISNVIQMRNELFRNMFDKRKDIDEECGYAQGLITTANYKAVFDRQGIGARVVTVYPEESWASEPLIYEKEAGQETSFDHVYKALAKRLNLYHFMERADIQSRISSYGVLFLGFGDKKDLDQPVAGITDEGIDTTQMPTPDATSTPAPTPPARKAFAGTPTPTNNAPVPDNQNQPAGALPVEPHQPAVPLMYVRVLDESLALIKEWETDVSNPRYGLPKSYTIKFADVNGAQNVTTDTMERTVHWSRVIHIADNRTTSEVFGTPAMRAVFDYVYDCRKILAANGEGYWQGGFPGLSLETQPATDGVPIEFDEAAAREAVFKYMNKFQRYLALEGMTVKTLNPNLLDPTPHLEVQLDAICITIGCPKRIFKGSERGELASSQDQKAWNIRIGKRQDRYLGPMILRPFIDRCIMAGVLPTVTSYSIAWPDTNAPGDAEKATVALTQTQAMAAYVAGDVAALFPPYYWLTEVLGYDPELALAIISDAADAIAASGDPANPEGLVGKSSTMPTPADLAAMNDTTPPSQQAMDLAAIKTKGNPPPNIKGAKK